MNRNAENLENYCEIETLNPSCIGYINFSYINVVIH